MTSAAVSSKQKLHLSERTNTSQAEKTLSCNTSATDEVLLITSIYLGNWKAVFAAVSNQQHIKGAEQPEIS